MRAEKRKEAHNSEKHQIDVFHWEAYKKMVAKVIKGGEINEINI
jgi:hypothetical protein